MKGSTLLILFLAMVVGSTALGAQVGTVLEEHKISNLEGDFPQWLPHDSYFGASTAALGDLNKDGTGDLAVSSYGSVWILFLDPSGRVIGHNQVTGIGLLPYGQGLANVGDLDGDGLAELAVSINQSTARTYVLAVDILFLRPDGTVRRAQRIEPTDPVFLPPIRSYDLDRFGTGLAGLGDADQDGVPDLVIGAPKDENGPGVANGALWIVYLLPDGRPKKAHKISERFGGGAGLLHDLKGLGDSIAVLGDLDGDGNLDLLAGEPLASAYRPGSDVLVLSLDQDEELRAVRTITQQEFGLPTGDWGFGTSLAVLGDLNGDGTIEFAVGVPYWPIAPNTFIGAVLLGSLRRDGSLARSLLVSSERGGFRRELDEFTAFGTALAALGDIDGDGDPDLAIGAFTDEDGAEDAGALWLVDLDTSAVRDGSGVNPLTLQQAAEPSVGHHWKVSLDCSGNGAGLAYVAAFGAPLAGLRTPAGELLVDVLGSPRIFQRIAPHAGGLVPFPLLVPRDVELIGQALYVQGLCTGARAMQLSNALDVIIGSP